MSDKKKQLRAANRLLRQQLKAQQPAVQQQPALPSSFGGVSIVINNSNNGVPAGSEPASTTVVPGSAPAPAGHQPVVTPGSTTQPPVVTGLGWRDRTANFIGGGFPGVLLGIWTLIAWVFRMIFGKTLKGKAIGAAIILVVLLVAGAWITGWNPLKDEIASLENLTVPGGASGALSAAEIGKMNMTRQAEYYAGRITADAEQAEVEKTNLESAVKSGDKEKVEAGLKAIKSLENEGNESYRQVIGIADWKANRTDSDYLRRTAALSEAQKSFKALTSTIAEARALAKDYTPEVVPEVVPEVTQGVTAVAGKLGKSTSSNPTNPGTTAVAGKLGGE